jgi:hypothetical protein
MNSLRGKTRGSNAGCSRLAGRGRWAPAETSVNVENAVNYGHAPSRCGLRML